MNVRTRTLLAHLDVHRDSLRKALAAVPEELRERQPEPGRWSVAEVLEHLGLTESRLTRMIARDAEPLSATYEAPDEYEVPKIDMDFMLDRGNRIVGPDMVMPRSGLTVAAGWQRLEEVRAELARVLELFEDRDLTAVKRPHPHPHVGELDLAQWVALIGAHEERHALQIREAGQLLAEQAS